MRIDPRWIGAAALAAALTASLGASACGVCVEDRVAAVYHQASIDRALARGQQVAFFGVEGSLPASAATRKALAAAVETAGVHGTARVSTQSATVSVAFDPRHTSVAQLRDAGTRALAPRGLALEPLRVIGADGRLRATDN